MTKEKNKILMVIILILISLIALVGSSYALLTKSFKSKKLSMEVGNLKIDFAEGNAINMDNAAPMTDENGMNSTPYTFTITNSGDIGAYYTVSNEEELANTLDTNYLHMQLTGSDGYNSGIKKVKDLGTETYKLIDDTYLETGKSVTYELRVWISSDAGNDIQDKVYKSKIVVNGASNKLKTVSEKLLAETGDNGTIDTSDSEQTFITGTDPNNYIWYSGKLWRAVSIDTTDNSVKLVTQWNISALPYNASNNTTFQGSYIEQWLNDTTVDGFLNNLKEPEKFIKTDSVWNATTTSETTKPAKTTMVTDTVGLLNTYEYAMSYKNATAETGYLNNSLNWWTLTLGNDNSSNGYSIESAGNIENSGMSNSYGIRPAINLKPTVKIIGGSGTSNNPYRLEGDNDNPSSGTLLSTRYSGEYIRFGSGENNLYRIVSHENKTGTKIASAIPLKENSSFKTIAFGSNATFSKDNTIGTFLNNDYLAKETYLTSDQVDMIEDNTTWYLGTVAWEDSYKLAKYQDETETSLTTNITTAKIGLLRYGELMTGQTDKYSNNSVYWQVSPYNNNTSYARAGSSNTSSVRIVYEEGTNYSIDSSDTSGGIRPAMNLKSNVVITGGDGTKNNPFILKLNS